MKKIFTLLMMTLLTTVGAWADDTYVVAGVTPLCGSFWDGSDAANQMTTTDNVNYKLVKEGLTLEKGTNYEFKVVKNGNVWIPDGGNVILTVEENGIYTVTFSYSTETQTPSATAVKTGDAVIAEKTWTVAGSSATLLGTEWDPTNTDNDMTKQNDGSYKLEKKAVTLAQGVISYKVCANHSWDESYGVSGNDASLTIEEDGVYDVVFTFNSETKAVNAEATKTGGAEIEKTYTVAGGIKETRETDGNLADESVALFTSTWSATETANDMTEGESGIYTLKKEGVELPVCVIECKVVVNHDWAENYGAEGGANVFYDIREAGKYDVEFTFNAETKELTVTATKVGEVTGISSLNTAADGNQPMYNLAGQRVRNAKGIVIQNGKKYIVK
ncbi:MAG: hypothetical protein J6W43_00265 [Prevotella sp.]|jgi:hypothetical protein|nr:hypothetical protein [Prevotella sp.]